MLDQKVSDFTSFIFPVLEERTKLIVKRDAIIDKRGNPEVGREKEANRILRSKYKIQIK